MPVRQHRNHEVDGFACHLLGALRARTHVAVHAGLIAAVADIDLQGVYAAAGERRKFDPSKKRPSIAHRVSRD